MGRYVSVQSYGDNNPRVVQVPYEQATGMAASAGAGAGSGAGGGDGGGGGGGGGSSSSSGGEIKPLRNKVEKVAEVTGSTAGASSASFHIYRAHRRTEMLRLEEIERRAEQDEAQAEYQNSLERKRKECDERTRKNAEKRRRKKQKKQQHKQQGNNGGSKASGDGSDESGGDEEDGDDSTAKAVDSNQGDLVVPVVQIKDDGSFLDTMKKLMGEG